MNLSKEQKKAALRAYKEKEKKQYCLKKKEVEELFRFLEEKLEKTECDHTLINTEQWLKDNICDEERRERVRQEINDAGGLCDCEVLYNCYEDYDM